MYISALAKDSLGLTALLLRPDGFVVWVSEGEQDAGGLLEVMAKWFGEA